MLLGLKLQLAAVFKVEEFTTSGPGWSIESVQFTYGFQHIRTYTLPSAILASIIVLHISLSRTVRKYFSFIFKQPLHIFPMDILIPLYNSGGHN